MADTPYILLSCGISLDGYLDDATSQRLVLSNAADLDRVDAVRAGCDAVLVGAGTVRADNPRLLVRSPERRSERLARSEGPTPAKVTLTATGRLDATAHFFTTGDTPKLVYTASPGLTQARSAVGAVSTVIDAGEPLDLLWVAKDLHSRGVRRLMVEGGGRTLTQFLTAGLADQLDLVVAPLFVGDSRGRRFVADGEFPWNTGHRATLADVRQIGDVVLLRYALSTRFGPA
ncbi:RibD family protein [Pedococcus sp.]|uniref:RibD family protein n=1 Tax=Pedococcus sp. TaxID=2860345 RepID=UPI002E161B92|nr:dihydrofolate reductase family protein [Pedococcus sp.]